MGAGASAQDSAAAAPTPDAAFERLATDGGIDLQTLKKLMEGTLWTGQMLQMLMAMFDSTGVGKLDKQAWSRAFSMLGSLRERVTGQLFPTDAASPSAAALLTAAELRPLNSKELADLLRNPGSAARLATAVEAGKVDGGTLSKLLFSKPAHIEIEEPPELKAFVAPTDLHAIHELKAKVTKLEGGSDEGALRAATKTLAAELAKYRTGAVDTYDKIHKLPIMVAAGSATFARLYDAARQVVQQQAGFKEFAPLMKSLDPLLPQEKPLQREADPIALREQGQRTLDAQYKPVLQQLEAHLKKQGLPCEVEAAPVKHLYRMVEKAAFREDEGGKLAGNANFVKDAVRGKCESSEMETLNEALRFLKKLHEAGKIKIVWYKDRFSTPSAGGWADGMLNFVVLEPPDERAHICELQLIHTAMMLQRQGMGGHGSYGKFRSGLELFAYTQATKDLKAMAASSLGGELGALTAQFEAWGRPEHGAFRNWGSAEPLKQWSKVELDEMGHVVKVGAFYVIDLSKSGLVPAFDALKHLKELEIENCKMPGTLEPLKACAALQRLKLYQNQLTGTLEPLKGCAALQTLELHNNQLTGTLEPLKACAALQTLTLNNNQLTGTLEPLKACAALQTLALQYNQLTGTLEPLKACAALQTLALNSNQLTGTLEGLKGCAALQRLALHNNQLTGTLEGLKGCAALQTLALNSNQLTGALEPLKGCAALQVLRLNFNELTPTEAERTHFGKLQIFSI